MQEPVINTLIYILRNPRNALGFPHTIQSTQSNTTQEIDESKFKLNLLGVIHDTQKLMIYKDPKFLK